MQPINRESHRVNYPDNPFSSIHPDPRGPNSLKRGPPGESELSSIIKRSHPEPTNEMTPEEYQKVYRLLLQAIEGKHSAENQIDPPEQLNITLLPHQKIGFNWMVTMEKSSLKGGLLSDDMGLGKTVQTIAMIVKQKTERTERALTLIVAPLALLHQWKAEIESKVDGFYLRVCIHHGTTKVSTIQKMKSYDVILTTYSTLAGEYKQLLHSREQKKPHKGLLFSMAWNRVVLDEAHSIKNKKTKAYLACMELDSKLRWCLTGTPIQNSIDDLFSIVSFLKVKPYNVWSDFKASLSVTKGMGPLDESFKKIRNLLEAISLRRCKDTTIDGQPILKLPSREVYEETLEFTADERLYYANLESKAQLKVAEMEQTGKLRNNYFNILVLLLRLRQACIHPWLNSRVDLEFLEEERALAESGTPATNCETFNISLPAFKRLVGSNPESDECPVCLENIEALFALSPCGHVICSGCFQKLQLNFVPCLCPICRGPLSADLLVPLSTIRAERTNIDASFFDESQEDLELDFEKQENRLLVAPSSSKLDKLVELLTLFRSEAPNDKIIIFTQFTSLFKIIIPLLKKHGFKPRTYDGKMSIDERADTLKQFAADPSLTVLLLSLHCGSVGLNLTAANRVIFLDLWWNPSVENQAIDRVHRIGQLKTVKVYKLLIPQTVEDRILELQKKKKEIFDNAFSADGVVTNRARLSVGELMSLFHS
ncbi:hypothetical protein DSO57_1029746 [Entomophthora muscae]|uniref:Uncharacterized protein n=1 Tax=Entomophthora muscae TaxID=34485 RepID=A0ACC2TDC3_9FUNG|nr:hypothetical protein DSO57_1029746 [Entomophthora muscae]